MDLPVRAYVRRYSNGAHDVSNWRPPLRRITTEDGDIAIERLCQAAHCVMLNPAGHIVQVPLANGSGRKSNSDPYRIQMSREKMEKGFLPVAICPKRMGLQHFLPKAIRDGAPCANASQQNPCECIVATRERRMSNSEQREARYAEKTKDLSARDQELRREELKAMREQTEALAEIAKSNQASGKKGKSE